MPPHEEDDFELVLGDRQLFFLAIVLLGVFFSIGYSLGYGRGRDSGLSDLAAVKTSSEASATSSLPQEEPLASAETLRPDSGAPEAGSAEAPLDGESGTDTEALAIASVAPLQDSSPDPPTAPARPEQSQVQQTSSQDNITPSISVVNLSEAPPGTMYLQVFSALELGPAQQVYLQMKSKGHPVALDNLDPTYFRIVIGPFPTREAADDYMQRLSADGIKSFLRKF